MKTRLVALAAALALSTPFTSAQASGTGTLTVGSDSSPGTNAFTATNLGYVSFQTDAGLPTTCTSSAVSGTFKRGTPVVNGAKIGTITSLAMTGCSMTDLNYPIVINGLGTWNIQVVGNPAPKSTSVNILITNVFAYATSTGTTPYSCEFGATGSIPGVLNLTTHRITFATTSFPLALQAYNGAGTRTPAAATFAGEIWTGDSANLSAVFSLSVAGGALSF